MDHSTEIPGAIFKRWRNSHDVVNGKGTKLYKKVISYYSYTNMHHVYIG